MGVKDFTDGVRALLIGDATFVADIQTVLGKQVTTVMRSNVPWAQINDKQLPCYLMEQGNGDASSFGGSDETGLTIGHYEQQFESGLDVCLLWNEQDRERAADQRAQLPDIFARLFLRNPQPGGVAGAWLQQWVPDQGVLHPRQVWAARIQAQLVIERDV
ncbi:hypothetical protein [Dyella amyloliquefaciens]|uniref:hypothetical protein n=1 Tax=Dyella amyloliquefaciens TaxID=1770545 RepID=UPI00102EA036|nr:hypothetical protein [Dyella amyloliquefaciens]